MQAIICGAGGRAIRGPWGFMCSLSAGGLATISCGASLAEANALTAALPDGVSILTWSGTTAERNATWANSPNRFGCAPRGLDYFDTTRNEQVFADGISSTNWSSTSSAGV